MHPAETTRWDCLAERGWENLRGCCGDAARRSSPGGLFRPHLLHLAQTGADRPGQSCSAGDENCDGNAVQSTSPPQQSLLDCHASSPRKKKKKILIKLCGCSTHAPQHHQQHHHQQPGWWTGKIVDCHSQRVGSGAVQRHGAVWSRSSSSLILALGRGNRDLASSLSPQGLDRVTPLAHHEASAAPGAMPISDAEG